jgi:hypothetical protein
VIAWIEGLKIPKHFPWSQLFQLKTICFDSMIFKFLFGIEKISLFAFSNYHINCGCCPRFESPFLRLYSNHKLCWNFQSFEPSYVDVLDARTSSCFTARIGSYSWIHLLRGDYFLIKIISHSLIVTFFRISLENSIGSPHIFSSQQDYITELTFYFDAGRIYWFEKSFFLEIIKRDQTLFNRKIQKNCSLSYLT